VLRRKFIAISAYIKKDQGTPIKSLINNLNNFKFSENKSKPNAKLAN
jgi:hypothetical protein